MGLPTLNAHKCIGKPVTIYALLDPRDHTAFYVGATSKKYLAIRLGSHVNDARHLRMVGPRYEVIRQILNSGLRPQIVDLEVAPFEKWAETEQFWIEYLRFLGAPLTNIGIGGAGAQGARQSKETQAKRRAGAIGRDMSKTRTPEAREKAAAGMRHKIEIDGVTYEGIAVAARSLGIAHSAVHRWLGIGRARRITPAKNKHKLPKPNHPAMRAVTINGVDYPSIAEAARAVSVSPGTVVNRLNCGRAGYAGKRLQLCFKF